MFFTLEPLGVVTVNYDNASLWSLDPSAYFNLNPQVTRDHFPVNKTGIEDVHFGLMIANGPFTTGQVVKEIGDNPHLQPITLADTNALVRAFSGKKLTLPLASFCGTTSEPGGHPYIAYVQINKDGVNLFFNWMTFRRNPDGAILVAQRITGGASY